MASLAARHDCSLLDPDGTLFRGARAIDGATEAPSLATTRKAFLTNNASRSAAEVAQHRARWDLKRTRMTSSPAVDARRPCWVPNSRRVPPCWSWAPTH
ncbi:hypothetical protein [Mycobacterium palustre]|uniref:hypothetical protein n=1 Tax=Mycobacterium palustre TaxID=153971 RepID=UPI00355861C0